MFEQLFKCLTDCKSFYNLTRMANKKGGSGIGVQNLTIILYNDGTEHTGPLWPVTPAAMVRADVIRY